MTVTAEAREQGRQLAQQYGLDTEPERPSGYLPETFWAARPVLARIRQAAHAEAAPADAVFYGTLARLSGMLSHQYAATTGIAGRASLNLFVATVAPSGGGKSTSSKVARELLPTTDLEFRDGLPVGSGEGIAEAYMGTVEEPTGETIERGKHVGEPVMRRVRKQVRHNAYFYVDEGQILGKLSERNGSVLGETLRRGAVGETLGQTNASEERTRYVPAGSYSLGLLVGFQPSTALPVLSDASTGTPQRFLWCWAVDPTIPEAPPAHPGPIVDHPGLLRPAEPVDIRYPLPIREHLRRERVARNRGELVLDELDGHAGLMKVKVSAILALLDGREHVTQEDWDLAEVVWETSCAVRDSLVEQGRREAEAAKRLIADEAVQQEVRAHAAKRDAEHAVVRIARLIARHTASEGGRITLGEMNRRLKSADRNKLRAAVDHAEAAGWVFEEDGHLVALAEG